MRRGSCYLGEVFVELWVEESHLWLHVLVQHQGEHWEHGVDGGIAGRRGGEGWDRQCVCVSECVCVWSIDRYKYRRERGTDST